MRANGLERNTLRLDWRSRAMLNSLVGAAEDYYYYTTILLQVAVCRGNEKEEYTSAVRSAREWRKQPEKRYTTYTPREYVYTHTQEAEREKRRARVVSSIMVQLLLYTITYICPGVYIQHTPRAHTHNSFQRRAWQSTCIMSSICAPLYSIYTTGIVTSYIQYSIISLAILSRVLWPILSYTLIGERGLLSLREQQQHQ